MTEPETFKLEKKRRIAASVEEVYAAWTDPEIFVRWFRGDAKHVESLSSDVRVGGSYEILLNVGGNEIPIKGEYLEVVPPHRLVFTWNSVITGHVDTRVSLDLSAAGDSQANATELVLVHEFFRTSAARDANHGGWEDVLVTLERMFI